MKTKTPDLFTATVYQILRAARAEGASVSVVTASFVQATKSVYGPGAFGFSRPAAKKSKKSALAVTHRTSSKGKEDLSALGQAAADRLKLSRKERALHTAFGEELHGASEGHRRLVAALDDQSIKPTMRLGGRPRGSSPRESPQPRHTARPRPRTVCPRPPPACAIPKSRRTIRSRTP